VAGRARTRIGSSLSITANRACATRAGQARDRARNTGKFGLRTDHDGAVKVQDKQGIGESVLVAQLAPFSFLKLRTRFASPAPIIARWRLSPSHGWMPATVTLGESSKFDRQTPDPRSISTL
jgi:hypothetical protein